MTERLATDVSPSSLLCKPRENGMGSRRKDLSVSELSKDIHDEHRPDVLKRLKVLLAAAKSSDSLFEVAERFEVSERAIQYWIRDYLEGGPSALVDHRGGSMSKLSKEQIEDIWTWVKSEFGGERPNNAALLDYVHSVFGVDYSSPSAPERLWRRVCRLQAAHLKAIRHRT